MKPPVNRQLLLVGAVVDSAQKMLAPQRKIGWGALKSKADLSRHSADIWGRRQERDQFVVPRMTNPYIIINERYIFGVRRSNASTSRDVKSEPIFTEYTQIGH
jgi:hypothetical protein